MALTKEDLQAIKSIVDDSVGRIENRMDGLEGRMDNLENRMDGLEESVVGLKGSVTGLENRMGILEGDVKEIKVAQIENRIIPVLEEVHKYQQDVYERYYNGAELFEKKISLIDQIDDTVAKHSKQIQELQAKMA